MNAAAQKRAFQKKRKVKVTRTKNKRGEDLYSYLAHMMYQKQEKDLVCKIKGRDEK